MSLGTPTLVKLCVLTEGGVSLESFQNPWGLRPQEGESQHKGGNGDSRQGSRRTHSCSVSASHAHLENT